jgi:hypothetical protein
MLSSHWLWLLQTLFNRAPQQHHPSFKLALRPLLSQNWQCQAKAVSMKMSLFLMSR